MALGGVGVFQGWWQQALVGRTTCCWARSVLGVFWGAGEAAGATGRAVGCVLRLLGPTVRRPSSVPARNTRIAISPRLAAMIFLKGTSPVWKVC